MRVIISNTASRLAGHFDLGAGLGTGLALVKSLLPPAGAELRFENAPCPAGVRVELTLGPPVIIGA